MKKMSDDLISREALRRRMYHDSFETDNGMQKWDSGLWIRYKIFENAIEEAQAADVVDKELYDRLLKNSIIISEALNKYQTADMVEVVRCKNCVHHKDAPKTTDVWCEKVDGLLPKDWFCADGARSDDANKSTD